MLKFDKKASKVAEKGWKSGLKFSTTAKMPEKAKKVDTDKSAGINGSKGSAKPKQRKPISPVSKTNKNERRKLPKETVEEVHERDGYRCVCCPSKELDAPHHAFY